MDIFQRTPAWIIPKLDRGSAAREGALPPRARDPARLRGLIYASRVLG